LTGWANKNHYHTRLHDSGFDIEKWRSITTAANRAFEQNNDSEAHGYYIEARDWAEILAPHWFDVEEATVALAISYQNLADLYLRLGKQNDALET